MSKKLYRESPLIPPKPSVICKGYTSFSPPEHKEQISAFMKSDLYIALEEWKNQARIEADLCERGSKQCVHWLSRLVLDWAQRGYLSLQAAELFRKGVLPWKQRWQHGLVTAEGLLDYFSIGLLFFGKVHFFETRTVCRKGSFLIIPLLFLIIFKRSWCHFL